MSKKKKKYTRWLGDDDYRYYGDDDDFCDCISSYSPTPANDDEYPIQLRHSYTDSGVVIGLPYDHTSNYIGMSNESDGHIAIIGGSGSGKTSGIAKPTSKAWLDPMVVTDIKGELSGYSIKLWRKGLIKRPSLVFNPLKIDGPGYDPFSELMNDGDDNLINNISEIALVIVPEILNDPIPYWNENERRSLAAGLLFFYLKGLSFSEAMCKIASEPLSRLYKQLAECKDMRIKMLLGDIAKLKPEHLASIDSGLRGKISVFVTDPHIAHAFRGVREGAECFSWDDLNAYNIFIQIPEERIEAWGPAVNLMYSQLIRYLERRPEKYSPEGADSPHILLLMDEFARFGRLERLPNAISTLRSKNVNICLIMQSLAQLDKIYGPYNRRIILDNCNYKAILSAGDAETQKELSELIGTTKVLQKSCSEHFDDERDTTGYSMQTGETREPKVFSNELAYMNEVVLLSPYGVHKLEKFRQYDVSDEFYRTIAKQEILIQATVAPVENSHKNNPNAIQIQGTSKIVKARTEPRKIDNSEVDKMLSIEERLENANQHIADAENKSEESIGKDTVSTMDCNSRKLSTIGEYIVKHFPLVMELCPRDTSDGKPHKIDPLDTFLSALSVESEFLDKISEKIHLDELVAEFFESSPECVDGQ